MTGRSVAAQTSRLGSTAQRRPGECCARAARTAPPSADGGNAVLELVILAPVLVLLICMVIASGRIATAQGSVDAAARDAARQASISRSPEAARTAALASASQTLAGEGLDCKPVVVSMGLAGFGAPLGEPASVRATVSCRVSLGDLLVPGLPGSQRLHATFSSPLDPFRGRTG